MLLGKKGIGGLRGENWTYSCKKLRISAALAHLVNCSMDEYSEVGPITTANAPNCYLVSPILDYQMAHLI